MKTVARIIRSWYHKEVIEDNSGLSPRGRAVLVEMYEPARDKGLIALPDRVRENAAMIEQRAVVLAIGSEAWRDERRPRAMLGDKVLITRFAGHLARGPLDGKLYRLVNANDIFCVIAAEAAMEDVENG